MIRPTTLTMHFCFKQVHLSISDILQIILDSFKFSIFEKPAKTAQKKAPRFFTLQMTLNRTNTGEIHRVV